MSDSANTGGLITEAYAKIIQQTAKDYINDLLTLDPETVQSSNVSVDTTQTTVTTTGLTGAGYLRLITNKDGSIGRLYGYANTYLTISEYPSSPYMLCLNTGLFVTPPDEEYVIPGVGSFEVGAGTSPTSPLGAGYSATMHARVLTTGEIQLYGSQYTATVNRYHFLKLFNGLLFFKDLGDSTDE